LANGLPPKIAGRRRLYRDVASYFMVHPDQADHYLVEQKPGQGDDGRGAKLRH